MTDIHDDLEKIETTDEALMDGALAEYYGPLADEIRALMKKNVATGEGALTRATTLVLAAVEIFRTAHCDRESVLRLVGRVFDSYQHSKTH